MNRTGAPHGERVGWIHHWQAAQQIIWYLLQTKNHGITFCSIGHRSDADFAGDVNDRRSTTGWIFTFNGTPISWASKKQTLVARLSMESDLIAGSHAAIEGVWLIKLGNDFKQKISPIPLYTDNQSFIIFSNNDVNNNRMKHINILYFYTHDQVNIESIILHYIPSHHNPADLLTKAFPSCKHSHMLELLGICSAWRGVLLLLFNMPLTFLHYVNNSIKTQIQSRKTQTLPDFHLYNLLLFFSYIQILCRFFLILFREVFHFCSIIFLLLFTAL